MKKIIVLGSTGSIGVNTLDVVRHNTDKVRIVGLSTKGNLNLLESQIEEFKPEAVAVWDHNKARNITGNIKVYSGINGLIELVQKTNADLVVSAMVGAVGLKPTLEAIKSGKDIALANKEVLIMAGSLIMNEARRKKVNMIPIDSEHSALWQCIEKKDQEQIKRVILTASGGPFYSKKRLTLDKVSPEEALVHPRWQMGSKVTIDSATLMNKGFEVIEASYLFNIPLDKIEVVIHPESIIHALVEFIDGSIIAHMHIPDMRIPIQYALSVPSRWEGRSENLDLTKVGTLNFSRPDLERFPALKIAYKAGKVGGTMPVVMSASDEVCVEKFLNKEIGFMDIVAVVEKVMQRHNSIPDPNIDEILNIDEWARKETLDECKKIGVLTHIIHPGKDKDE